MKDQYRTTARHFEIFKKEAEKWIQRFGLLDWDPRFFNEKWNENNKAGISFNAQARTASFNLEPIWNVPLTNYEIRQAAFHEVCELLLSDITLRAEWRSFDKQDLVCETHRVIARLENAVFDREMKKK